MACKLIWSPAARDDLRNIVRFIARDNPQRAESFGYELMRRTEPSLKPRIRPCRTNEHEFGVAHETRESNE